MPKKGSCKGIEMKANKEPMLGRSIRFAGRVIVEELRDLQPVYVSFQGGSSQS